MPIQAKNKGRYPPEWPLIPLWVRVCAGWRCEWSGLPRWAQEMLRQSSNGEESQKGRRRWNVRRLPLRYSCFVLGGFIHRREQDAVQGEPHPRTGSKVVLTAAHVDNPAPEDVRPGNLSALCQACHLGHDRKHHLSVQAENRRARMRTLELELAC
jgi:hypothetical protein